MSIPWRRHWAYGKYVVVHKYWVFLAAWSLDVTWLGLLHDLSKLWPSEWLPYSRHFYLEDGTKRTYRAADGFYRDPANDLAFKRAWLAHIHRNKHHPQHWVTVRSARCLCSEVPTHVQYQYGLVNRPDVLLNDEDGAECLTCRQKLSADKLRLVTREMPLCYRLEMIADWVGAGRAQGTPDVVAWYKARGHKLPFGPETRNWVECALGLDHVG